ncbi:hypothetical protein [Streptomyces sp. NPDC054842]
MGDVIGAAARFPTVTFTSAVVVVLGFWLLVLLGQADARAFDADAPLLASALGGMPVTVAATVVIGSAWLVSLTGTLSMDLIHLSESGAAVARGALLVVSGLAAWLAARACPALPVLASRVRGRLRRRTGATTTPYDPGSRRARCRAITCPAPVPRSHA